MDFTKTNSLEIGGPKMISILDTFIMMAFEITEPKKKYRR